MKKYIALAVIAMLTMCGILSFFFIRMGMNDTKALADFSAAYHHYDQAIANCSKRVLETKPETVPSTDDLEQRMNASLDELNTIAAERISSLTKNDAELMKVSAEIAGLANQEVDTLKAYHCAAASESAEMDVLAQQLQDLKKQRQADYASFLELAGSDNGGE